MEIPTGTSVEKSLPDERSEGFFILLSFLLLLYYALIIERMEGVFPVKSDVACGTRISGLPHLKKNPALMEKSYHHQ